MIWIMDEWLSVVEKLGAVVLFGCTTICCVMCRIVQNAMPFLEAPKPPQKLPHREGKEITTSGQGRKEKRRPTARKKDVKPERRSSVARKGIQPSTQPLPRRKRAEGGRKRSKKKS